MVSANIIARPDLHFNCNVMSVIVIVQLCNMSVRQKNNQHSVSDDLHLEPCCQYAFYRMKQFLPGDKVALFLNSLNFCNF